MGRPRQGRATAAKGGWGGLNAAPPADPSGGPAPPGPTPPRCWGCCHLVQRGAPHAARPWPGRRRQLPPPMAGGEALSRPSCCHCSRRRRIRCSPAATLCHWLTTHPRSAQARACAGGSGRGGHRLGRRCEGESRLAWAPVMLAVLAWAAQQSRLSSCRRQCCDVVPGRRGRWRWLRRRHRVLARGRRGATRGALEGRPGPGPRRANAPRICARAAALVRGRPARARRRRGAGHRLW